MSEPSTAKATSSIVVMATLIDDEPVAIIQHRVITPRPGAGAGANAEVVEVEMHLEVADVLGLLVGLAKFTQQVLAPPL